MIFDRSFIGTPVPPSTRRKLHKVRWLLAHEVGVDTPKPNGRYRSADPNRVLSDAQAAASYGISAGKSWEYNYMIGLDGSIFTQAGEYMGAHCKNFNPDSAGVIFLNATDVPINQKQILAWYEVRNHMVKMEVLSSTHDVAPHYRFRKTSCPGIRADPPGAPWPSPTGEGRLGNLQKELLHGSVITKPPESNYQRIVMASSFEFATATRWDTRGFGEPLNSGTYTVRLNGSAGKVGATVNMTIVNAKVGGYATLWPSGPRPVDKSKINYEATKAIANEVSVPLAADGSFLVYISSPAHIIFDLTGYWLP